MKKEIVIIGSGGQGIQLFGELLAEAAAKEGREVSLTSSYGAEVTGGKSKVEVIISDEKIDFPGVLEPDIVVLFSAQAVSELAGLANKNSLLIFFDAAIAAESITAAVSSGAVYCPCSASKFANEIGNPKVANIVMLGYLIKATGLVNPETVIAVIEEKVKAKFVEINKKAFEKGREK